MTELFDWNEEQAKEAANKLDRSIRKSREGRETLNEAFAARRAELLAARQEHFKRIFMTNRSEPDFAPWGGFCTHWNIHLPGEPRCNYDLVAHFGDSYPTADITRCPKCSSSYCD